MAVQTNIDSRRWDMLLVGSIVAFIALLTAIVVFIISAIAPNLAALKYLDLIKDLTLIGAVAISAYAFISNKSRLWKIIYWVCIAVVIIAAIFGNMGVI